jgi:hypothetical protein
MCSSGLREGCGTDFKIFKIFHIFVKWLPHLGVCRNSYRE